MVYHWSLLNEEVSAKRQITWDSRYGTGKMPLSSGSSIRNAIEENWFAKYGCWPIQHPDIIKKANETVKAKTGCDYTFQTESFKEKSELTMLERYGVKNISQTKMHKEAMAKTKGYVAYNDGISEFKIAPNECINPSWNKGGMKRRKRTEEEKLLNRSRLTGSKWYNDGVKNYKVAAGASVDESWVIGHLPRKYKIKNSTLGNVVYNDGIKNYVLRLGDEPDPSWIKGMAPRKK